MRWGKVTLGELLVESRIPCENPDPNRRIRVKLHVQGVEKRPFENEMKGATTQFIRKAGQFIYGKQNLHKGAFGVIPNELDGFETSADIPSFDVREDCLPEWIYYYFKSGNRYLELEKLARGVGSQRIHPKQIYDIKIPFPPKEIQRELIQRINTNELKFNEFVDEQFQQLNLLKKLRHQILQDAVQGKLVPQDFNDEPASVLLERLKAEKEKLVRQKKIRQGKLQEAEFQEDLLFEIPKNWSWCNLDDICYNITDGTHQTPTYTKTGRIFLSAQNVKPFKFMPEVHKYVGEQAYQEYIKNRKPELNDILVARVGAGIGEAAVINHEIDFSFYVSLGLIQPFKQSANSDFITLVINSPYGVKYAKGNISSKGGSAGNFNLGRIRSFQIPFPPLKEQQCILDKVEQLMTFCDELEQSIQQSQKYTQNLLQVALKEALESN